MNPCIRPIITNMSAPPRTACSSFAGRQALYERFFSGDPWRLAMARYQSYPLKEELKRRVWDFLDRTAEWEDRPGKGKSN